MTLFDRGMTRKPVKSAAWSVGKAEWGLLGTSPGLFLVCYFTKNGETTMPMAMQKIESEALSLDNFFRGI